MYTHSSPLVHRARRGDPSIGQPDVRRLERGRGDAAIALRHVLEARGGHGQSMHDAFDHNRAELDGGAPAAHKGPLLRIDPPGPCVGTLALRDEGARRTPVAAAAAAASDALSAAAATLHLPPAVATPAVLADVVAFVQRALDGDGFKRHLPPAAVSVCVAWSYVWGVAARALTHIDGWSLHGRVSDTRRGEGGADWRGT